MRRVILVRHCESEANAAGLFEGRGDSPLTPRGRAQAERLAACLAARGDLGAVRLASSHQARARTTAAAIAAALEVAHELEHDLREGDPGVHEGKLIAELGRVDETTHGGETIEVIGTRALAGYARVCAGGVCDTLIMVSHGFTISTLVRRLYAGHPDRPKHFVIANGDYLEIVVDEERFVGPPHHTRLDLETIDAR
jgi:probable phosphoglycerate mutase